MSNQNVVQLPSALEGHARRIKKLMESWTQNTIAIGKELLAARENFPLVKIPNKKGQSRPGWDNWVKQNTGIQQSHAYALMKVATRFESGDTSLKATQGIMILLSRDTTPGSAKQEIRTRLERGEHVGQKQARQIVKEHKFPKPAEANKQARETGIPVQASDGYIYFGATKEEAQLAEDRRTIVYGVRDAIVTLAEIDISPLNFIKFMLPHQRWRKGEEEEKKIEKASKWLHELAKEWGKWEDKEDK